jgi:hypothetical protein
MMASGLIPRYFVGRGEIPQPDASWPLHAIDSFIVGGRHIAERECIVLLDQGGNLSVVSGNQKVDLPEEIQAQLAYNEVANSTGRLLNVKNVLVFKLDLLEQTSDAPGFNDPVYLYGNLYGCDLGAGVQGQLTVTRADLLEGIVRSAKYAFQPSAPGTGGGNRCFHILLPADREEEIASGSGVVIAYPLMPAELSDKDTTNEQLVAQMLYDVLNPMRTEMLAQNVRNPLCDNVLPVPNRAALEAQLEAEGYAITGDTAKKRLAGAGLKKALQDVVVNLLADTIELPPEGTVDDLLDIARRTLEKLRDWPSERSRVLRTRLCDASAEVRSRAVASHSVPPRAINVPKPSGKPYADEVMQRASKQPPDWMMDFINEHRKPGAESAKLTSSVERAPAPSAAPPRGRKQKPETQSKPEWMSDFE